MSKLDKLYEAAMAEAEKLVRPFPVRPSSRTPSEPGYAYHATNEERAFSIAEDGLETHAPSWGTDQDMWPDGSTQKRSYHSKEADTVWAFAPEEGPHVILRTPLDKHPFKVESGTRDLYTRKTIPSDIIEILLTSGWTPLIKWAKETP